MKLEEPCLFAFCEKCKTLFLGVRGSGYAHPCTNLSRDSETQQGNAPARWALRVVDVSDKAKP